MTHGDTSHIYLAKSLLGNEHVKSKLLKSILHIISSTKCPHHEYKKIHATSIFKHFQQNRSHASHVLMLCNMLDQLQLHFDIIERTLAGPDEFRPPLWLVHRPLIVYSAAACSGNNRSCILITNGFTHRYKHRGRKHVLDVQAHLTSRRLCVKWLRDIIYIKYMWQLRLET